MKQQLVLKPSQLLRNCELEQCTGRLAEGNRVCALGAIMVGLGWNPEGYIPAKFDESTKFYLHKASDMLNREYNRIILSMNDGEGKSFAEIADYLYGKGL